MSGLVKILIPVLDCLLAVSKANMAGRRLSAALQERARDQEHERVKRIIQEACDEAEMEELKEVK